MPAQKPGAQVRSLAGVGRGEGEDPESLGHGDALAATVAATHPRPTAHMGDYNRATVGQSEMSSCVIS